METKFKLTPEWMKIFQTDLNNSLLSWMIETNESKEKCLIQKNYNLTENTSHLRLFFGSVELPSSMEKEGGNFFTLTFLRKWKKKLDIAQIQLSEPHWDIKMERSNLFTVFAAPETQNMSRNVQKFTSIQISSNLICALLSTCRHPDPPPAHPWRLSCSHQSCTSPPRPPSSCRSSPLKWTTRT